MFYEKINYFLQDFKIGDIDAYKYTIIYSENDFISARSVAYNLRTAIINKYGYIPNIKTDESKENQYEIIVGKTNRGHPVFDDDKLNIRYDNGKLYIYCGISSGYEYMSNYISKTLLATERNLKINESKMEIISFEEDNVSKRTFDFLGYRFSIMPKSDDRMGKKIEVDIAEKKINKLKKRIVHSFISYVKDNDLGLLKCRLRFLTGVVRLQKSTQGTLCAGNAFNYSELTSCKTLRILDGFVRNLLLRNTSRLEKLVFSKLSETQKNDLLKISFAKGYESRLTMNYTRNQAKKIRNAWRAL